MRRPQQAYRPSPQRPVALPDLRLWLFAIAAGLSLIVLLPILANSQALPPSTDFERRDDRKKVELSGEAKNLARSYVYVLDQLDETIDDYTDYFEPFSADPHAKALLEMLSASKSLLDEGVYHLDVDRLYDDLDKMADRADNIGDQLMDDIAGTRPTNEQKKLIKLARHLQQDLLILYEQLEFEIIDEANDDASLEIVSAYFVDSLAKVVSHTVSATLIGTLEGLKAAQRAGELSGLEKAEMWEKWADSLANAIEKIQIERNVNWEEAQRLMPDMPAPPVIVLPQGKDYTSISHGKGEITFTIPESRRVLVRRPGEIGMVKVFADSTEAIPSGLPIQVENPIGEVTVIGWPKNFAVVRAEIEVAAKTESEAKGLTEKVGLQLNQRAEGLMVEVVLPSLSDPSKRIVNCNIHLKTPQANPISASSSFGDIHVSKMRAPVTIAGSNSLVTANDIAADLTVTTDISDLRIDNISGTLTITNSLGAIEASDIIGTITITNTTGAITLTDSRGEAVLRNTGHIDVREHIGSVDIDNSNGLVEVSHVQGDLMAQNAYRPLNIESITGAATVRNVNAGIHARELGGIFTATNNQGPIDALELFGPVHLINTKAPITVSLRDADYDGSTISSTSGTIELLLSPSANLTVNAQAVGGHIRSPLPISLTRVGETQNGTLLLGGGRSTITVSGTNSTIVIDQTK